jgi:hypothetical protein
VGLAFLDVSKERNAFIFKGLSVQEEEPSTIEDEDAVPSKRLQGLTYRQSVMTHM